MTPSGIEPTPAGLQRSALATTLPRAPKEIECMWNVLRNNKSDNSNVKGNWK